MNRDASNIAPPGYFERTAEEFMEYEAHQKMIANEALYQRIVELELKVNTLETVIGDVFEKLRKRGL